MIRFSPRAKASITSQLSDRAKPPQDACKNIPSAIGQSGFDIADLALFVRAGSHIATSLHPPDTNDRCWHYERDKPQCRLLALPASAMRKRNQVDQHSYRIHACRQSAVVFVAHRVSKSSSDRRIVSLLRPVITSAVRNAPRAFCVLPDHS